MTVTSKTKDCESTYTKSFRHDHGTEQDYSSLKCSISSLTTSGTKISVCELFERMPFRRKAVRTNIEVLRVKEFIQRISVLYHEVGWLLIDGSTEKVIIKLAPQESVSARFAAFHGETSQWKMKVSQSNDLHTFFYYYFIILLSLDHFSMKIYRIHLYLMVHLF
jgi:DNA mismatch repair ATPase MutL